jgi:hypothetical protein
MEIWKRRGKREKETCTRKKGRKENSHRLNQMNHQSSFYFFYFFQFYNNNGYLLQRHKGIYDKLKLFLSKEILVYYY